jgi:hypothetical protein
VGVAINYQKLGGEEILESIGLVVVSAQTIYHTYWKDASLRSVANKGQD